MFFASDAGPAREQAARTPKASLLRHAERAAPVACQHHLENNSIAAGLAALSSLATAAGILALIGGDSDDLPLLHPLAAGLSIAVLMMTIIRHSDPMLARRHLRPSLRYRSARSSAGSTLD